MERARAPDFAPAYWGSAICSFYRLLWGGSQTRDAIFVDALTMARSAIELDPSDSMSHTALGYRHFVGQNHGAAIEALETAIDLDQNNYLAPRMLGISLTGSGRAAEGLPCLHRALKLSPRDPLVSGTFAWIGTANLFEGDIEAAAEWARKGMRHRTAPRPWVITALRSVLGHQARRDEARWIYAELLRVQPGITCGFVRDNIPIIDGDCLDRYVVGLRKAGLPE